MRRSDLGLHASSLKTSNDCIFWRCHCWSSLKQPRLLRHILKSPGMIVTAGTLSTPVVSSGYYYPGIVLSVLVRIRLCLIFSCFFFHWRRVLTYIEFHTSEFFSCWESNRCFLGKQQRLFGEIIRSLIHVPKSLPVLSTEPWLRNEDPSLNGKRTFVIACRPSWYSFR